MVRFLLILGLLFTNFALFAQTECTTIGQNPNTAFPVCGTSIFQQASVPLCGGKRILGPCNVDMVDDRNPFWYKFTCFTSGTLAFRITPNNLSSDYDWQIFDITNRNPMDVFTDATLFVACNWSGESGVTGASSNGNNLVVCGGLGKPLFSSMPAIVADHTYLLLISHFSATQSGYGLAFDGGTASITDTTVAKIVKVSTGCEGKQWFIKLNKKLRCASLALNGSDFSISPALATITAAKGMGCDNGFDVDSIVLTLNQALPAGTYQVKVKNGTDNNTLLDLCNNPMSIGEEASTQVLPALPAKLDSIAPLACRPAEIKLFFRDSIRCSTIASDGSDFSVSGGSSINVVAAIPVCSGSGFTTAVTIQLAQPITKGGFYVVSIKQGTDGNTLLNFCDKPTLVGESKSILAYDTVAALIGLSINNSCSADTVRLSNSGGNGINSWKWSITGENTIITLPAFSRIYSDRSSTNRTFSLEVTNGVCTDKQSQVVDFSGLRVKAAFDMPVYACPEDTIRFIDKSTGPVATWLWTFGNGNSFLGKTPPFQRYASSAPLSKIPVRLLVIQGNGCRDSITKLLQVPNNCLIGVPTAFTPNGDGLNDNLYPLNAWKAEQLHFRVYNRLGQIVFETTDWTRKWNGNLGRAAQNSGLYVWHLNYILNGKPIVKKGTTLLIR